MNYRPCHICLQFQRMAIPCAEGVSSEQDMDGKQSHTSEEEEGGGERQGPNVACRNIVSPA